jgi:hypothetical protein
VSDKDDGGKGKSKPGRGARSIQTWWGLAAARQAVRDDPKAREQLEQDPEAFFQKYGVSGLSADEVKGQVEKIDEFRELNEFELEKEGALLHQARGGVAWVAVAWAGVLAVNGAVVLNAAYKYNAVAQANANANVNWNANVHANWNVSCGA